MMGQSPYQPHDGSVVDIFYKNRPDCRTIRSICDIVGVSPQTITKWDREGVFPHWALETLGFVVTYGEPETPISALKELRDQLNDILEGHENE
jgi:hypothetical protein